MARTLTRPSALFFPVAVLLAALLGNAQPAVHLLFYYYLLQLCSLCAVDAFRDAAAQAGGPRGLFRRLGGALLPLLTGFGLCIALSQWPPLQRLPLPALLFPLGAALCLLMEQLLEEYLFAWGDALDGFLCALISSALLTLGLALDGNVGIIAPYGLFYALLCAAVGALIALIVVLCHVKRRGQLSLAPRNLRFAPKAMLETLSYPLAAAALYHFDFLTLPAALVGLMLWRLLRTVCRRSQNETLWPAFLLSLASALAVALSLYFGELKPFALAVALCYLLATAVFLHPSLRLLASLATLVCATLLLYAPALAGAPFFDLLLSGMPYICIALALIGVLLNGSRRLFFRRVR